MRMVLVSICYTAWNTGLILAATHSVQSHAYVLNNSVGAFVCIFRLLRGIKVHRQALVAVLIVIVGALLIIVDPSSLRVGQ